MDRPTVPVSIVKDLVFGVAAIGLVLLVANLGGRM